MNIRESFKLTYFVLFSILSFVLLTNSALAETKTFIKEYIYQASDKDSKNSSRTISMREVKRLLLEELGSYLESVTEVQNFKLTKDQITILTAGIVQTEIIDEKWNGHTYWLKSKITADSGDVIKSIDTLRKNRQKTKELEDVKKRSDELLKENERLRAELATAKSEKKNKEIAAYNKTIKELDASEWVEKGYVAGNSGNHGGAITAFSKAIELSPQFAMAYYNRGTVYSNFGKYNQAISDYNKAIELNPQLTEAYNNRGAAYSRISNYNQAIADYDRSIELNPQFAMAYYNRGNAYRNLGKYSLAISDYDKAVELNPRDAEAYSNRGITYYSLGNKNQAISDYNKAIELNPQNAEAYNNRGIAYKDLGNNNQLNFRRSEIIITYCNY